MKRALGGVVIVAVAVAIVAVAKCRSGGRHGGSDGAASTAGRPRVTGRPGSLPPRDRARSEITGTVRATAGEPVAGATVCARIDSIGALDDVREAPCTTTDATGRYRFEGLPAGQYQIGASAATFVPAWWTGPAPDRETWFWLAPGERRAGVDLALARGGARVRGVVHDVNGGPIADAWVEVHTWSLRAPPVTARSAADGTFELWTAPGTAYAFASAQGYARGEAYGVAPSDRFAVYLSPESVLAGVVIDVATTRPVADALVRLRDADLGVGDAVGRTNADGRFRIAGLPPGRYTATAEAVRAWGQAPHSIRVGLADVVDDIEIRVHPAAQVAGRILIDDGTRGCPRGYASLEALSRSSFAGSDAEGRVRFDGVPPGDYRVRYSCDGYSNDASDDELAVGADGVTGVEWILAGGERLVGTVRDTRGDPVASASVSAGPVRTDPQPVTTYGMALTDSGGGFVIHGLEPGRYAVVVSAPDTHGPPRPVEVTVAANAGGSVDLVVEDGGSIAGIVVDDRGTPVPNARVQLAPGGGGATAGDDGRFIIRGLAAGTYEVIPVLRRRPDATDDDERGERVEVRAGAIADVRVVVESETGVIAGTVVDTRGAPIADASLVVWRESGPGATLRSAVYGVRMGDWYRRPVVTDVAGAFRIETLAPGSYTLRAFRRGGEEVVAEHVAVGVTNLRLVIAAPATLAGTVTIRGRAAPEDLLIHISRPETAYERPETFFRTGGAFRVDGLSPGTYTVRAHADAGSVATTVTLAEGEQRTGVALEIVPVE